MHRTLVIAVLCAIVGAVVGATASRALARRHQQTHAVMWLAQIHLGRLEQAARAGRCGGRNAELDTLSHLQAELILAFPLAYGQDAEFRARADTLAVALRTAAAADCAAARQVQPIRDACDACHHEYR